VIRFGISWVARLLGVSGFTVQQPTTRGSLQDLNISERVIPFNPSNLATNDSLFENPSEATQHLKRFQDTQTKLNSDSLLSEASNDQDLVSVIATLKSKLYQESIKSKHYTNAFNELNERLVELEKIVQPEKKTDFQKLQGWVHSKRHIH
jgi:predicted choloylglycine hydrolase